VISHSVQKTYPNDARNLALYLAKDQFADEGKLAAYFGIVPRIAQSNGTEHSRPHQHAAFE
jgi:hypothetical protein